MQAETLAWKLFQEVLPIDVNMYTVQVSGDAEPNAGQWTLIDRYFDGYRKKGNGTLANQGNTSNGNSTGLDELIKKVVETCNASGVKVIDEVPIHHMQMNRMPVNQTPNY